MRLRLPTFRSLFWKIFFSFWLANIFIIVVTSAIIIRAGERERFVERYKEQAQDQAEFIIQLYESQEVKAGTYSPNIIFKWLKRKSNNELPNNRYPNIASERPAAHKRIKPVLLTIHNQKGDLVFSNLRDAPINKERMQLELKSESDELYKINAFAPPSPRTKKIIRFFTTLQFILVFFASTIASLILSWSIARPLKKLSEFSRLYEPGTITQLDKKLLNRSDEIGELSRRFEDMLQRLENILATQKQLLHDISHELRAPLSRLQVSAALLEDGASNKAELTQRLHQECGRINSLIQEILDLARLEQSDENLEQTNLLALATPLVENARFIAAERHITLAIDPNLSITTDKANLSRAFENLLGNALNHTPANSPIEIQAYKTEKNIILCIKDFGPGVAEEELDKLFGLFYRGDNAMHGEGFGLGLGIAKRALAKASAELELANHSEGGLIARIKFLKD